MNVLLWILQILLALHTVMGAVWKFSHSEKSVPSLKALPHGVWKSLIGFDLLCSVGLLLPVLGASFGRFAAFAAGGIAAEMLLFTGVHFASRDRNRGPMVYWLGVAALCAVVVYGRTCGGGCMLS